MTVNVTINDVLIFGGAGLSIGALAFVTPLLAIAYLGVMVTGFGLLREARGS